MSSALQLPQPLPRIPSKNEVVPIVQAHQERQVSLIETITKTVRPESACFENVIKPLAQLDNDKSGSQAVIAALQYAADKETQRAVDKVWELWRKPLGTPSQRADLFELIKAVKEKDEPLHFEDKRLVEQKFLGWTQSGHGVLQKEAKERFSDTQKEIGSLCSDYHRNLREYDAAIWFTDAELDGIPKKDLDRHPVGDDGRRHYSIRGKEDVTILMKYARSPTTRKIVEAADASKNAQNSLIFNRVIHLRSQNAQLGGFKSHAAYRLPYRIAESTEWIEELLETLAKNLVPYGLKEFQLVQEKKRRTLAAKSESEPVDLSAANLESWDVEYYRRLIEEEATVDQDKIAEYFPIRQTVGAMLELFSSFLQLRFVQLPTEMLSEARWSEDVEVWSVWDERPEAHGGFIGYLYIDILERPDKYKGNQCVNLQPSYLKEDGTRVYPVTTLMCCFPRPTSTTCALLKHRNVVTLFHELGHGIHDLLARTKYSQFHGFNVCPEFGEGIGATLENFCWNMENLKAMSCHYTSVDPNYLEAWQKAHPGSIPPAEKIPDKLLKNLLDQRPVSRLLQCLKELPISIFDMSVHNPSSPEVLEALDEVQLYKDLHRRFKFYQAPEPSHLHVAFGHLLAGYDAGYYSYLCASVFAEELFQDVFAKDPSDQTAWDRFRRGILEYGGSRNERELLEEFLGRAPTPDALIRALDLDRVFGPI